MFEALKAALIALPLLVAALVALAAAPREEGESTKSGAITLLTFDCAAGEAAENPLTNGVLAPRRELLDTIDEAELFLCIDLPEVSEASNAWSVTGVNAVRSHPLARFEDGAWIAGDDAYKYAETYYTNDSLMAFVSLIVQPEDYDARTGVGLLCAPADAEAAEEVDVTIADVDVTLWVLSEANGAGPNATICWRRDGLFFYAAISFEPGVDVESEVLPMLEAIE